MELDKELKQQIIKLIHEGKPLPVSLKILLFPPETKQMEYELIYGIKEREEDVLADTMSVPFQPVKQFGDVKEGEWHNMLIFGDNLQALKFMMKDPKIKGKVRLIYIDPPFGTGELYDAAGVPAYSAALQGAAFVEFLRKRLILLKKLLADDGSIYVRIDYHFGHYVKVIMDEVFVKHNFRNEIVVNRIRKNVMISQKQKSFPTATDSIFFYTKRGTTYLNEITKKMKTLRKGFWRHMNDSAGQGPPRTFFGKTLEPPRGKHWKYSQENIDKMIEEGRLRLECKNCGYVRTKGIWKGCPKCGKDVPRPKYWVEPSGTIVLDTKWTDIPGYTFRWKYPTENSEELLERIIKASSHSGDIVLDCFAGSGTTGAVAEKLGRRWIMVDSSKLAIYTMIKRMLNLKKKIGNKGESLTPKPFVLYNAGLYEDHAFILNLGEEQYKQFAMELFQVEPKWLEINGLRMDGILFSCPVKVFPQKGFLTEEYVDDLHKIVGEYLKGRMFLIAPASRVYFLQDYIEKDGIRYYVLRIPYSVIDELHKKAFTRPLQPTSVKELNQLIEQVGFDFVHPPDVKAKYYRRTPKDKLTQNELIIEINEFKPVQRVKEPIEFKDPKDALSMVLVDTDYNGKYFNLTHRLFADEIKKNKFIVRIPAEKVGKQIMIIYLDILGNERVEVKSIEGFPQR